MSSQNQNKRSIPNAFDQARNTGTVGGSGVPPTEENTNIEKKKATNTRKQKVTPTDIQQSTDTSTQKTTHVGTQQSTNSKDEEKIQQTMKMRKSLSVRVKVYAATHYPETISSVIEAALEEYLAKRENQ